MTDTRLLQKRTNVPGQKPGITDLALGEIGINTHDGKMFLKRNAYGEIDIVQVGDDAVENVFYVSKSGKFGNTGKSLGDSFKTIDSAVSTITELKSFAFDEAKCRRDFGYLFDGLYLDMALGTNYNAVTSGLAYQRAGSLKVVNQQLTPTRVSFNQARGAIGSVDEVKASIGQDGALYRNNEYWSEVVDILINGETSTEKAADDIRYPVPSSLPTADADDAAVILQNNREWLKDELTAYISNNFPAISYDRSKCRRDTGFIVEGLIYDLMTGSNYNTVTAGLAYYRGNAVKVLSDQKNPTISAIIFLRDKILDLPITDATKASIRANVQEIVDILTNGIAQANELTFPSIPYTNDNRRAAGDQLQNNKELIIDEIIKHVAQNFDVQNYDEVKCRRDTGYIIDAVAFDLITGSNYNTVTSGLAYQRANSAYVLSDQKEGTTGAIEHLRDAINTLSLADITKTHVTDSINEIIDVINNGIDAADAVEFPTSPVVNTQRRAAGQQIQSNKELIIDEVIKYISENFSNLTFDRTRFTTDVERVIKAVTNDLATGSNYSHVTVGRRANADFILTDDANESIESLQYLATKINERDIDTSTQNFVTSTINEIIDIITNGDSAGNTITFDPNITSSVNEKNGALQLQVNKTFIVNQVISYIETNFPALSYNVNKCRRDVGYILDGVIHDLLYDGNYGSRQSAQAYFVGAASQLGGDSEVTASIAAYRELKDIAQDVILEIYPGQDVTGTPADSSQLSRVGSLLDLTIDTLVNGDTASLDAEVLPDLTGVATPASEDYQTIFSAIDSIASEVLSHADLTGPVQYDRTDCRRDTSYILDALTFDIQYGGNVGSRYSADAYFVGVASQLGTDSEVAATIGAYTQLKTVLGQVVTGTFEGQDLSSGVAGSTETDRLNTLVDVIIDVLVAGNADSALATLETPDSAGVAPALLTDYNLIRNNTLALQDSVIAWADIYGPTTYDKTKCRRDTSYILDALTHDLLYGGNVGARASAFAYYEGAVSQLGSDSEVAFTLAAYDRLDSVASQVIKEEFAGQNTDAGVATDSEVTRLRSYIDIITDAIAADSSGSIPPQIQNNHTGLDLTDYNIISNAKPTIQDQVVTYADRYGPTSYDRTRCRRDVGFIVDGLTFDVLYGGTHGITLNTRAYFVGALSQLGNDSNEIAATVGTYNHLSTIIGEIVQGEPTSNITYGYDSGGNGGQFATATEATALQNNVSILTGAITAGSLDSVPAIVEPDLSARGTPSGIIDAITGIDAIRDFLITQSINAAKNTGDTTIFLKSGDYVINNPIKLPPKTAIVGDNLRTTTVRPASPDSDMFYMDNGCFIKDITFRDNQNFAAAVAYDPRVDSPGAGPFIVQSPYIQNCTVITNDGVGMRVDGSKVSGLRSMVSDAFTQYNAAGYGVHMMNRGYAQLVSIFTISTQTSILAEGGGQCSITNSNSSFGDFGLVARGSSPVLYRGVLDSDYRTFDDVLTINNSINLDSNDYIGSFGEFKKPNYGDAMVFDSEDYFYTVLDVDSEGDGSYTLRFEPPLNADKQRSQNVSFRQRSVITSSSHTFEYVGSGTNTFTAIPQNGGIPRKDREVVYDSGTNEGLVVFTSTDELGDFRIGSELTIRRQAGRIEGETFERSLYAILTPYILALEG